MNERTKQLAEQAGFYFYDMHDVDGQDLGESIEADSWSAADKFAELIVKETISEFIGQLWNYGIDESNNPSFYKAVDRTKEHFGVEK